MVMILDFDTQKHLSPGGCSWSSQLLLRDFSAPGKEFFCQPPQLFSVFLQAFSVLPSSFFLKKMYQIVDLATPDVFVIPLMGLF